MGLLLLPQEADSSVSANARDRLKTLQVQLILFFGEVVQPCDVFSENVIFQVYLCSKRKLGKICIIESMRDEGDTK